MSSANNPNLLNKFKKIERLEAVLNGSKPDRTPVALWRHFPVDDQKADGLAAATLDFQNQFDFDFIKVTPTSSFCLKDWGSVDEWNGASEGTRDYIHRVIKSPEDWEKLSNLDPYHGFLGEQITCLQLISSNLSKQADPPPYIQTIFSPLSQAKNLVGGEKLVVHLRKYPDQLRAGLRIITENTIAFIEAAIKTGIAGVFYAVQHANYNLLAEGEFSEFGKEFDLQVLSSVEDLWLNILHLHGFEVMFNTVSDYPVQIINWHDRDTEPDLGKAQKMFSGVSCGGLQRESTMVLGSPVKVMAEARDAIQQTQGTRFILGTGCVLPITAPRANIFAARKSVER